MVTTENLYIIGNGFDLYHGLATSYVNFAYFLRENYEDIYEMYTHYFALPDVDLDDPQNPKIWMWNEFERRLSSFMADEIIEDNWDLADGPSAPDFKYAGLMTFSIEMEKKVDLLIKDMPEAFREFVISRKLPALPVSKELEFKAKSLYLNFNYTDTLERYYNLNHRRILYIHGEASRVDSEIILGHGVAPERLYKREEPLTAPEGMDYEEYEAWCEIQSNKRDPSTDDAIATLQTYYHKSHKPTKTILKEYREFFWQLRDVKAVYVLGHSMAEVDLPYFGKVAKSVKMSQVDWFVSYYADEEQKRHWETLAKLGVPEEKIHLFRLPEMVRKVPELFDRI